MSRRRPPAADHPLIVVARVFAALRLGCTISIGVGTLYAGSGTGGPSGAQAVAALGLAYAVGIAALAAWRPGSLPPPKRLGAIDLGLVAAMSLVGFGWYVWIIVYPILPVLIALVARPLATFLWSCLPVTILVAYALAYPSADHDQETTTLMLVSVGFIVPALVGAAFSAPRSSSCDGRSSTSIRTCSTTRACRPR